MGNKYLMKAVVWLCKVEGDWHSRVVRVFCCKEKTKILSVQVFFGDFLRVVFAGTHRVCPLAVGLSHGGSRLGFTAAAVGVPAVACRAAAAGRRPTVTACCAPSGRLV